MAGKEKKMAAIGSYGCAGSGGGSSSSQSVSLCLMCPQQQQQQQTTPTAEDISKNKVRERESGPLVNLPR